MNWPSFDGNAKCKYFLENKNGNQISSLYSLFKTTRQQNIHVTKNYNTLFVGCLVVGRYLRYNLQPSIIEWSYHRITKRNKKFFFSYITYWNETPLYILLFSVAYILMQIIYHPFFFFGGS